MIHIYYKTLRLLVPCFQLTQIRVTLYRSRGRGFFFYDEHFVFYVEILLLLFYGETRERKILTVKKKE